MSNKQAKKPLRNENLNKIYEFKVSYDKKTYRIIEIKGSSSLYRFARTITKAFDFYFDHCFGFYNNIKDKYKSTEKFELFFDLGEDPDPDSQSVEKTKVATVFFPTKLMLFFFDYGDSWHFFVECLSVSYANPNVKYPLVTKRVGRAPEQYPSYDEDDDFDEDEGL